MNAPNSTLILVVAEVKGAGQGYAFVGNFVEQLGRVSIQRAAEEVKELFALFVHVKVFLEAVEQLGIAAHDAVDVFRRAGFA